MKRKVENKKLDEIGKAVIKADAASSREIDRILANPQLFDSVRMRIQLGADEPVRRGWLMTPGIAAFASVALVAAVTAAIFSVKSSLPTSSIIAARTFPGSTKTVETKRFPKSDEIVDPKLELAEPQVRAEKISTRPNTRISRPKEPAAQQVREANFYALSYAGDPNETERGGRIVRVEISRSTLFAMGVNVPLENETDAVNAELLVGNDGVTRAIRVVE